MKGKRLSKDSNDTVEQMFNRIALRYDFLNHFLSFGIDKSWRKKLIKISKKDDPKNVLDIATGTGDMLIAFHKAGVRKLAGLDPSTGMLAQSKIKLDKSNIQAELKTGFCEKIPFSDNQFDLITVVFGIRNFNNLQQSFAEIHRVLKSGGKARLLEFSMPKNPIIRLFYKLYLKGFIPLWGRIISHDKAAYQYLSTSIKEFSKSIEVEKQLEDNEFLTQKTHPLSFGIASIYTGIKK
ncbi:MAG: bifunctional demethylmenaquinone methyltransferase/2-methoxy-6-polyprenyl-1,4-benzoquinol methylase UbiE [Bacteroidota bacterium]|nr:bifunctional demethylmenaquinone methyltransferase/2-methoxy-6-polyprenyl-1,4-benzoquinol methylase UbiE [Bacteroidota bacterium]